MFKFKIMNHSKNYVDALQVTQNPEDYHIRDVEIANSFVKAYEEGYNQALNFTSTDPLPELNKKYDYFDDGKIHIQRRDKALITEIIPFDMIDKQTEGEWLKEVKQHSSVYSKQTDYFIKGKLEEEDVDVIFVRTVKNKWFSLGWNAGGLDIEGNLLDKALDIERRLANKVLKE